MSRHSFNFWRLHFFWSDSVSWRQGFARLEKATWHSCMKVGWDAIHRGDGVAEWRDYWVLALRRGSRGVCVHYYPYGPTERQRRRAPTPTEETP